jgi:hypothetical protein
LKPAHTRDPGSTRFPRRAVAVALIGTAVLALAGVWLVRGTVRYYTVTVRWRASVAENQRRNAEHRLSIYPAGRSDSDAPLYMLGDTTRRNVAALVNAPEIDGVTDVDLQALSATNSNERNPWAWLAIRYQWIDRVQTPDKIFRRTALVPLFAMFLVCALAASPQGRAWLTERVPRMSPTALGLFRITFAMGLAGVVQGTVRGDPAMRIGCYIFLALFAAGFASRLAFVGFVVLFTRAHLANPADHGIALPLKTLWLMILVPWGAGVSVDRWLWRRVGRPYNEAPSRWYGLAIWIPVLMLGLGYAAAAFAKIDEIGPRWITGGAVKYFFLVDELHAPVHWGRYIVRSDTLSVVFSAAAVLGESSVILAAMWPTTALLLVAGLVALGLHIGFFLFQGVWWSAWWALLPAFVPWEAIASRWAGRTSRIAAAEMSAEPRPSWSAWVAGAVLFAAVIQQPVASFLRRDYWFLLSDFPMYSNVYFASRAEMAAMEETRFQPSPIIRYQPANGPSDVIDGRFREVDRNGALSSAAQRLVRDQALSDAELAAVRGVLAQYVSRYGTSPRQVDILADTWRFDWSVADFVPRGEWRHVTTIDVVEQTLGSRSESAP